MDQETLAAFRTQHRVFEPQLSSALGWLIATTLSSLALLLGPQPPEVMSLICAAVGSLLLLRVFRSQLMADAYRYLVRDLWRTLLYGVSIVLALTVAAASVIETHALPGCAPVESFDMSVPLGRFHLVDLAAGVFVGSLVVGEASLFRRTLAVQYLWPSSPWSYWLRWSARIISPSLILLVGLGAHRLAASPLWGPHLDARKLAGEVMALDDSRRPRLSLGASFEDEEIVAELVTLGMCQADDRLAEALTNAAQVLPRPPDSETWRTMEDYIYRERSDND